MKHMESYTIPSFSFLKTLVSEGAPIKAALKRKERKKTLPLIEGSAIDTATLEPEKFGKRFHIVEKLVKEESQNYQFCMRYMAFLAAGCSASRALYFARKYSKHRFKLETLQNKVESGEFDCVFEQVFWSSGKTCITPEIKQMAFACRESVRAFEVSEGLSLGDLFDEGMKQVYLEWENPSTGLRCRGYADCITPAFGGFELKSTIDASPESFARRYGTIQKLKYVEQVAAYAEAYSEGIGFNGSEFGWYIVAVEKTPPYMVAVYKISDFDLEEGSRKFSEWCAYFQHIVENGLWNMGYEYFARYRAAKYYGDGFVQEYAVEEKGISNTYETDLYG